MFEISEQPREAYQPSGKVNWFVFLPGLAVATGFTMFLSVCLYLVFEVGYYLIFIAPLLAALMGAGVWSLVLKWSHCRNKTVAGVASVFLGLILYLGYYQLGIVAMFGPQNIHRVDMLPRYILFRMQTDVVRDVKDFKPGPAQGPNAVQQGFNWFFFGGELICVVGMYLGLGAVRASSAYCESCRKWMKSETVNLAVGSGSSMWEALRQGNAPEAHRHLKNIAPANPQGCSVVLEHCPVCNARSEESRIYLTVTDIPLPQAEDASATTKKSKGSGVRKVVEQVALESKEIVALAPAFAALKGTIDAKPELAAEVKQIAVEQEKTVTLQAQEWPHQYAHVEKLEGPTSNVILTTRNAVIQTIIGLGGMFGGFGLAFLPAGIIFGLMETPPDWLGGVAVVWLFACLILSLVWILFYPTYLTTLFMRWRSRNAFASRADSAVDWQDPNLVFVDIVPRANWGKVMLENASDIGFVEVNQERRELIFEGDRERYWIPAESILDVKHEFFAEGGQDQTPSLNHLIVVHAMTEKGPWETWFYRRHSTARPRTANRKVNDALELESRIRELMRGSRPEIRKAEES